MVLFKYYRQLRLQHMQVQLHLADLGLLVTALFSTNYFFSHITPMFKQYIVVNLKTVDLQNSTSTFLLYL
jgi:hypothetical protein